MKHNSITILLIIITAITLSAYGKTDITKPNDFVFGQDIETVKKQLEGKCSKITQENIMPIQLPTAKKSQDQINCSGYIFAGQKRDIELVFADGKLDLVWILTTAEEERFFVSEYTKLYGDPTHKLKEAAFFLNHGVGVRNNPHEVLFLADRLKAPYKQWLDSQAE